MSTVSSSKVIARTSRRFEASGLEGCNEDRHGFKTVHCFFCFYSAEHNPSQDRMIAHRRPFQSPAKDYQSDERTLRQAKPGSGIAQSHLRKGPRMASNVNGESKPSEWISKGSPPVGLAERLKSSQRFMEFIRRLSAAQSNAEMASLLKEVQERSTVVEEHKLRRKSRRRQAGSIACTDGRKGPMRSRGS